MGGCKAGTASYPCFNRMTPDLSPEVATYYIALFNENNTVTKNSMKFTKKIKIEAISGLRNDLRIFF